RRSKKSLLQRGLRAMNSIFVGTCFVHQLWEFLRCVGCYGTVFSTQCRNVLFLVGNGDRSPTNLMIVCAQLINVYVYLFFIHEMAVHRHSSSCITAFVFRGRPVQSDSSGFIEVQSIVKPQKSTRRVSREHSIPLKPKSRHLGAPALLRARWTALQTSQDIGRH
ncbi:MAG: hypothetical protein LBF66_02470, partial [Holosporales bacterium]|nr:hypothetical protein [Holosporales bacterium]